MYFRNKIVKAFFNNKKFEGLLISEDESSYLIRDKVLGLTKLPKNNTQLTLVGGM